MTKHSIKPLVLLAAAGTLSAHLAAAWLTSEAGLPVQERPAEPLMLSVVVADAETPPAPRIPKMTTPRTRPQETAAPKMPSETSTPDTAPVPAQASNTEAPQAEPAEPAEKTASAPAEPVTAPPKSGLLVFDVYLGAAEADPLARMTHELKFSEQGYEIYSRGEALGLLASLYSGLLTQRSVGLMTGGDFSPQQYSEQKGKKPESVTLFDHKTTSISFGGNPSQPLPDNTQDRLSVIYSLTARLKDSENRNLLPKQGDVLNYKVANTQSIEDFEFECLGYETVAMTNGAAQAMKLRRVKNSNGEKTSIELWFNPNTDWLPIQIRLTDKRGMVITQRLHG